MYLLPHPIPTLFPYTTLFRSIGAGGQLTRVDIQCDQGVGVCNNSGTTTMVVRADSYGAYEWCNNKWVQLRSEEHTSELQSRFDLVCRLLLEKKKNHR